MNEREKLIAFCRAKNEKIQKEIGSKLMTEKDLAELETWDIKMCKLSYGTIKRAVLKEHESGLTWKTCPWCPRFILSHCNECGYGERNEPCSAYTGRFKRTCRKLKKEGLYYFPDNEFYRELIKKLEAPP